MTQPATTSMGALDPLEWAKKPRSQWALDFLRRGSGLGDSRLAAILADHVEAGVCDDTGRNLLKFWNGSSWMKQECR